MTLTDFIFDTLKEVVSEYSPSRTSSKGSINNYKSKSYLGNDSGGSNNGRRYPYAKKSYDSSSSKASGGKKRLISEQFVLDEIAAGRKVVVGEGDIVTPSARDILNRKN